MKDKPINPDLIFDLINAFKSIKSADESALFLQDILTASEIKQLSIRLRIARLLLSRMKQRDISVSLSTSIATVTKVSSWLNQRGNGFKNIIKKLPLKYSKPKKSIRGPIEYHLPEAIALSAQYIIADKQNKRVEKLIDNLKSKSATDKELKEISDEEYKHR